MNPYRRLTDFHIDRFWLGFFVLRQVHLEYAILKFGTDFIARRTFRKRETPSEAPISALDAMVLLVCLLLFCLAFSAYRKHTPAFLSLATSG
jgi:hypothetical protein